MGRADDAQFATSLLRSAFCSESLREVRYEADTHRWILNIGPINKPVQGFGPVEIAVYFWRLFFKGVITITSEDHLQKFGLPAPLDAGEQVMKAITGKTIREVTISVQGDLVLSLAVKLKSRYWSPRVGTRTGKSPRVMD